MDPEVVSAAKKLAQEKQTSISSILENYLARLTNIRKESGRPEPSKFLRQIPAKKPTFPYDKKSDDQWLEENLKL